MSRELVYRRYFDGVGLWDPYTAQSDSTNQYRKIPYTRVRKVLVTSDVSRSLDSLKQGDCRSYLRGKKSEYALWDLTLLD